VLPSLQGVLDGELRQTCTACATTLLLEFGYLSHLSGIASYGAAAAAAARTVFGMRSRPLGCAWSAAESSGCRDARQEGGPGHHTPHQPIWGRQLIARSCSRVKGAGAALCRLSGSTFS
jgi:hypothetical protein